MTRAATRFGVAATVANLVGLGLAVYLTVEHYSSSPSYACPANSFIDCEKVTASAFSTFAGVPVAVAGVVYFVVALPLHLPVAWRATNPWLGRARWAWAGIGMISVFWLIYGELDVGAICLYCTGVHLVTFVVFALTVIGSAAVTAPSPGGDGDDGRTDPAVVGSDGRSD